MTGENQEWLRAPRRRWWAIAVLVVGVVAFFAGLPGAHGGGPVTAIATYLGLASIPVAIAIVITGVSTEPGALSLWLVRLYVAACLITAVLSIYDLSRP
ncbi:MAG TPA: hypothetical protein VF178_04010 [Gemmatimonadaceae bacterium]